MVAMQNWAKFITVITGASHFPDRQINIHPSTQCHIFHNKKLPDWSPHILLNKYCDCNDLEELFQA